MTNTPSAVKDELRARDEAMMKESRRPSEIERNLNWFCQQLQYSSHYEFRVSRDSLIEVVATIESLQARVKELERAPSAPFDYEAWKIGRTYTGRMNVPVLLESDVRALLSSLSLNQAGKPESGEIFNDEFSEESFNRIAESAQGLSFALGRGEIDGDEDGPYLVCRFLDEITKCVLDAGIKWNDEDGSLQSRPLPPQSPKAESDETWTCDYCDKQVPEGNDEVWLGKNHCFCSVACLENYQARFDESDAAPADQQAGEQEKL